MKYKVVKRLNEIAHERLTRQLNDIDRVNRKIADAKGGMNSDTIIRKDINETIDKMLKEGISNISIKIYLANKYPDRIYYILKMIKYHNDKKIPKNKIKKEDNER